MPSRREIIRLAELLASAPTVSYREQEVLARIRHELDRVGVSYAADRWGNLIAAWKPRRSRGRPVAFTAHADHPGLIVAECKGRIATARWLGGVQSRYFRGAAIRIETEGRSVRGRILSATKGESGRIAWVRARLDEPVPPGSIGGWDLSPFRLNGPWIRTKSADDLLGCAAVLSLLLEAAREHPPFTIYGVFTRAEEEGLLGATVLAADHTLPMETAVVVLETSKELPCGRMGKGPIVRVGDRKSVYTPAICQALHEAAEVMAKDLKGFRYQRCLMDGGVCEATSFQLFGYEAGGLALPLGNYHNMGARVIEEETVHRDDLWNLCRLLPPAAARLAAARDGMAAFRARVRKRLAPARRELARSLALGPPPHTARPRRTKTPLAAALLAASLCASVGAKTSIGAPPLREGTSVNSEAAKALKEPLVSGRAAVDPRDDYDALQYDIFIGVDPDRQEISGTVGMRLRLGGLLAEHGIVLDLSDVLTADSAAVDGTPCQIGRPAADQISITGPGIPLSGEMNLHVRYHGPPDEGLFAGFKFFSNHGVGSDSFSVVSTLSEPENSHSWWPCKDRMDDKARVRLTVETPAGFVVAANGNRMREETDGATTRSIWESGYPISPYLVSFAATNYVAWDETYRAADGDSLLLQYFIFPEDEEVARVDLRYVVGDSATSCLTTLEQRFGPYPFRDRSVGYEKLGIAEVPWGSLAMEHQTCVSMGDRFFVGDSSRAWAFTHEIAHQWWGDAVTPTSLDHVWLSEGFATYCEALHVERLRGAGGYRDWMGVRSPPEATDDLSSLVAPDPAFWFLQSLTYNKGAWLLHMLRGELGETEFFSALNFYLARYLYANASTEQLIRAVEESCGRDLHWFFVPWAYGLGRPEISWDWWADGEGSRRQVRLHVRQEQGDIVYPKGAPGADPPDIFSFHLPVRIFGDADSLDRRLFVGERNLTAVIDSIPFQPKRVVLDPDHWILATIRARGAGLAEERILVSPNPSRGETTFLIRAFGSEPTAVDLFDVQGRRIRALEAIRGEGFHAVPWNGTDDAGNRVASGVYLLKVSGSGGSASARVVLAR